MKKQFYLITSGNLTSQNYAEKTSELLEIVEFALKNEITMIQIREKKLSAKELFTLTEKIVKLKRNSATKILVNERADVALAAQADGVHLTSVSVSAKFIRKNFPRNFVIGVSTHSLEEVLSAKFQEADFATFSPIFSKQAVGIEELKKVVESAESFPVFALGGIDSDNIEKVWECGASGVAAIRFLNNIENLQKLIDEEKRN